MGIHGTRGQQQQQEEALQLVVRCLWRESAKQDTGGAARCQCQRCEGVQPLGLCGNLINALTTLLANQQRDGDSPIQSIVTGLHVRSRRGIMDGLRNFIRADTRSAVNVDHLRPSTRPLHVQKPSFSDAFAEAATREGADELSLRADEVGTLRASINMDHIEFERG